MKHLPKLLGTLLLALTLLTSMGLASTSAHAAPIPAQAATTPSLAPNVASVKFAGGGVVYLSWDEARPFPEVTQICTGSATIAFFDSHATGPHFIMAGTCQSFQGENGFVSVVPAE
jgi:hypothetical protein